MPLDMFMVIRGESKIRDEKGKPTKKAPGAISILGESLDADAKPKNAFDLEDFQWGAKNAILSNTYSSAADDAEEDESTTVTAPIPVASSDAKIEYEDFSIEKLVDSSTPLFFLSSCRGYFYDSATIFFRKETGTSAFTFLLLHFIDVQVQSWSLTVGDSGTKEKMTFSYSKMRIKYVPQSHQGAKGVPKIRPFNRADDKEAVPVIPTEFDQL